MLSYETSLSCRGTDDAFQSFHSKSQFTLCRLNDSINVMLQQGQLEKQGTGNGRGTGTGNGNGKRKFARSCLGRDDTELSVIVFTRARDE